jgi:hypothetical protein
VVQNKVLRRIFGVKIDEETGGWRKLPYGGILNFHSPPSIIRIVESRTMGLGGKVVQT